MRVFPISVLILLLAAGCAGDDAKTSASVAPPTPSGGGTGPSSDDGLPASLVFDDVPELTARQQVVLTVHASPSGVYPVRFALAPSGGDPLDAVLDLSQTSTDEQGQASVLLTAPSSKTSFDVRATSRLAERVITLTVSERGVATIRVEPSYPSSLRDITTWVATAHTEKSCAELPGIPPEDGDFKAAPAAKDQAPLISDVPAGTRLAVTLRSGHYVGGCTSVEMLPPGPPDNPQVVKVTVLNRPIDLSESSLEFSLDLEQTGQTWSDTLGAAAPDVLRAMLGSSTDDVDALLDAMRQTRSDSLQAFESARKAEGWDALLRGRWGQTANTKLRDTVTVWLSKGKQSFLAAEHPFSGVLSPLSEPEDESAASSALLTLQTVAGLDAEAAGFVARANASWSAGADDTVLLSTDVYFVRSELATALADAAAQQGDSSVESGADALVKVIDCAGIADTLASTGADPVLAYADCDSSCLVDACQAAVTALWQRGAAVDGLDFSRLSVTASGKALVGDTADLKGLTGSWIGELADASGTHATAGALTAAQPAPAK